MTESQNTPQENEFKPIAMAIQQNDLMSAETMKGIAEVQAAVMLAKRFPRDQFTAFNKIMEACQRKNLAENAVYAYPRGGKAISGPSIRLAEAMAREWGNIDSGIRELSRDKNKSVCEAFAWDLETNARFTRIFEIPHERHTREGSYKLTDPRDIYENVANQGARRLRACILQAIPGDITDSAVAKCKETVTKKSGEPLVDRMRKMANTFATYGITQAHIEKRLKHALESVNEEEIFDLITVYNAIKDNHAKRSDYFDIAETEPTEKTSSLKDKIKKGTKKERQPGEDDDEPETTQEQQEFISKL
jgi:hypothetical protein